VELETPVKLKYICAYHMKGEVEVEVMLCKPVFAYFDREAETGIRISRAVSSLWVLEMKLLWRIHKLTRRETRK
jgi:hypothetical protein